MDRARIRQATASAASIAARRAAADDSALEMLPDDPLGVVRHVLTHRKVPMQHLRADALDGLSVIAALRADLDREELSLLRLARKTGASWQAIATASGITSRQGAEQRALRLEFEHDEDGPRLESLARGRRRGRRREEVWLRRSAPGIRQVARGIVAWSGRLPEELGETIDALAEVLADGEAAPGMLMPWLSTLISENEHLPAPAPCEGAMAGAAAFVASWDAARGL